MTDLGVLGAAAAPIRLVTVDAHPLVRWALRNICEAEADLDPVGDAEDADSALSLVAAFRPHVVTIDAGLPGGRAWQLTRALRSRYADLGIVILSGAADDEILLQALEAGASAFLSSASPVAEVVAAVRHAAAAASSFSAAGLAQALRRRQEGPITVLSPRERQVLALLRDGRSVPQVARELYVSLSTAKTYVARLYEKLGATNRAQALMTAVRLGLLDAHPDTPGALQAVG